jgi:hypothetical protein
MVARAIIGRPPRRLRRRRVCAALPQDVGDAQLDVREGDEADRITGPRGRDLTYQHNRGALRA